MDGSKLRELLKDEDIILADLAKSLNMSPQAFNSKLNAKKLSLEFVNSVSKAINKNVYELSKQESTRLNASEGSRNVARMTNLMTMMFEEIKENNTFLRSVVDKGIKEGAIVFDKNNQILV